MEPRAKDTSVLTIEWSLGPRIPSVLTIEWSLGPRIQRDVQRDVQCIDHRMEPRAKDMEGCPVY